MDRKLAFVGAALLAVVGVGAGVWSLFSTTGGGSSRQFGRVGMSESPPGAEGEREFVTDGAPNASPEGENVMRMSRDDLPEGMRELVTGDGMDPSSFSFPDIEDEDDVYAMFDELMQAVSAKASGATAYRQAPPIAKQRFAEAAVEFLEPFFVASARPEDGTPRPAPRNALGADRGLEGEYFGQATALASLDVAQLRVSDAPKEPEFALPPGLLDGLAEDVVAGEGDDERRVQMSFSSSAGGWSHHQLTHPSENAGSAPLEGTAVALLTLPLRSARLGSDVEDSRFGLTMWWDEASQEWRAGKVTLRFKTEDTAGDGPDRRRRMEFHQ